MDQGYWYVDWLRDRPIGSLASLTESVSGTLMGLHVRGNNDREYNAPTEGICIPLGFHSEAFTSTPDEPYRWFCPWTRGSFTMTLFYYWCFIKIKVKSVSSRLILASVFAFYLPATVLIVSKWSLSSRQKRQTRSIQKTACLSGATVTKKDRKATKVLSLWEFSHLLDSVFLPLSASLWRVLELSRWSLFPTCLWRCVHSNNGGTGLSYTQPLSNKWLDSSTRTVSNKIQVHASRDHGIYCHSNPRHSSCDWTQFTISHLSSSNEKLTCCLQFQTFGVHKRVHSGWYIEIKGFHLFP